MPYIAELFAWARKRPVYTWLYTAGILVLLGSGLFWWLEVRVQPERVFAGMLEQSMSTHGVTVQASQEGSSKVDFTLQYSLGAENRARSLTTIEQAGSKITTETIGTRDADFKRYRDIATDQTNDAGEPLDVAKIEGVWSKTADDQNGLLAQAVLGLSVPLGALPVPIANLQTDERQKLLDQIKDENVYEVDYKNVEKHRENGRLHYTYKVKMQVILYAHLMKEFAAVLGMDEFDNLDPNQYSGSPPLELEMTVDVRSHHLVKVEMPDPAGNPPYEQVFSGYDIPVNVDLPESTISEQELQKRLQEL